MALESAKYSTQACHSLRKRFPCLGPQVLYETSSDEEESDGEGEGEGEGGGVKVKSSGGIVDLEDMGSVMHKMKVC